MGDFMHYEIERCKLSDGFMEVVTSEPYAIGDIWTVYGRLNNSQEVVALYDFETLQEAREKVLSLISE